MCKNAHWVEVTGVVGIFTILGILTTSLIMQGAMLGQMNSALETLILLHQNPYIGNMSNISGLNDTVTVIPMEELQNLRDKANNMDSIVSLLSSIDLKLDLSPEFNVTKLADAISNQFNSTAIVNAIENMNIDLDSVVLYNATDAIVSKLDIVQTEFSTGFTTMSDDFKDMSTRCFNCGGGGV